MKKFLLFATVALMATSASATEVVLADTDFSSMSEYSFWKEGEFTAELKDGGLTITNETAKDQFWALQYMVADNMQVSKGTEYSVSIKIKGFSGALHYVMGAWGKDAFSGETKVEGSADWQTVTFKSSSSQDIAEGVHFLLQTGEFVGSYTIASVKITYDSEAGSETPNDPVTPGVESVIATMYPGPDNLIGWGGSKDASDNMIEGTQYVGEVVDVDGRQAYKITHEVACTNPWDAQFAFDTDYVPGTTYYFTLDVKGDPGTITSGFQCTDGWVGCGDVKSFEITPEWTTVKVDGIPTSPDGKLPNRWVANVGSYVGAFYISNMTISTTPDINAVETISSVQVNSAVYNLQGVKVADSLDQVAAPGLYITNGKKVIKK